MQTESKRNLHYGLYASLDFWRGISCLLVIVFHIFELPWYSSENAFARSLKAIIQWFWCGVPFFFVISGYCIANSSIRLIERGGSPLEFVVRRWRRILPPYWCFLLITVAAQIAMRYENALNGWWPNFASLSPRQWIGTITLTETWLHHLFGVTDWKLAWGHAWTLCYEEQFYLIAAFVIWLGHKKFFAVMAFVTCCVLVTTCFTFKDVGIRTQGFFFDGYWLLFATGLFVFWYSSECPPRTRYLAAILIPVAFVSAIIFNVFVIPRLRIGLDAILLSHSLVFGFGFASLIQFLKPYDECLMNYNAVRPLAWIGRRCYSVYLVHVPVIYLVAGFLNHDKDRGVVWMLLTLTPLCILATLASAHFFFNLIEKRFHSKPASQHIDSE